MSTPAPRINRIWSASIIPNEPLLNFNINELEEIESRLFALRQLAKKHAVGKIEELKDIKCSLEDKLSKIYENSDQISNLSKNRHISEKNFKIKLFVKKHKVKYCKSCGQKYLNFCPNCVYI